MERGGKRRDMGCVLGAVRRKILKEIQGSGGTLSLVLATAAGGAGRGRSLCLPG